MTFKKTGAALDELREQRDTVTAQISQLKKEKSKLTATIKSIEKLERSADGGSRPKGKKRKRAAAEPASA